MRLCTAGVSDKVTEADVDVNIGGLFVDPLASPGSEVVSDDSHPEQVLYAGKIDFYGCMCIEILQ